MTENSIESRRSYAGYLLLVAVVLVTITVYLGQTDLKQEFDGTYPEVIPAVEARFEFLHDRIEIKLSRDPAHPRILVFAYDEQGRQVTILKPVYDRKIIISQGDLADYRVNFEQGSVDGYELLKKAYGLYTSTDFFRQLVCAKDNDRRYGVQECLYPACTMCMDVCPVIANGVIGMPVLKDGRIHPVIHYGGCPRCGKCFKLCKLGVIFKTDLRHSIKPDFLKNGNIDDPDWEK